MFTLYSVPRIRCSSNSRRLQIVRSDSTLIPWSEHCDAAVFQASSDGASQCNVHAAGVATVQLQHRVPVPEMWRWWETRQSSADVSKYLTNTDRGQLSHLIWLCLAMLDNKAVLLEIWDARYNPAVMCNVWTWYCGDVQSAHVGRHDDGMKSAR